MFGAETAWREIPHTLERHQLSANLLTTLGKRVTHRKRTKTEERAKVVAAAWGKIN